MRIIINTLLVTSLTFSFLNLNFIYSHSSSLSAEGLAFANEVSNSFDTNFSRTEFLLSSTTGSIDNNQSSSYYENQVTGTCKIWASDDEIYVGSNVTIFWETTNFSSIVINGETVSGNSGSKTFTNLQENTTYTLVAKTADGKSDCTANVKITCLPPPPVATFCQLDLLKSVNKNMATSGEEIEYTIRIKNTGTANCSGSGVKIVDVHDANLIFVSEEHTSNLQAGYVTEPLYNSWTRTLVWNGDVLEPNEEGVIVWKAKVKNLYCNANLKIKNTAKATAKELNNFGTWVFSNTVETVALGKTCEIPLPTCSSFKAEPSVIEKGSSTKLIWTTTNASRVVINNGIGQVALNGSTTVSLLNDTEYILTAYGQNDQKAVCQTKITVKDKPASPTCSLTAYPSSINSGSSTKLIWTTTNASSTNLTDFGLVELSGEKNTGILTSNKTYTLNVLGTNGETVSCKSDITVLPVVVPISCQKNVNLSISPSSIQEGDSATISWTTTGISGIGFDNGISANGLSGSISLTPNVSTVYTMTATDGKDTISCPVNINVTKKPSTGGGGGGSSLPTCELSVSKTKIKKGDEVRLKWDSNRATGLELVDSKHKVIATTDNLLGEDKKKMFDGSVVVKPTSDTTYTLTVNRGSRDRECKVKVDVEDKVVVTQIREQKPLVSAITLSEVPYTGFEAGPFLTFLFYLVLMLWSLYVTYLIVIRKNLVGNSLNSGSVMAVENSNLPNNAESNVVTSVLSAEPATQVVTPIPVDDYVPADLPVYPVTVGYGHETADQENEDIAIKIENFAHTQKVLISSGSIRYFISVTDNDTRFDVFKVIIEDARNKFPVEDGWVVINETRMRELCESIPENKKSEKEQSFIPTIVPDGAGSLAEAIIAGNVVASYKLLGDNPMFALVDAANDLDLIIRNRKGEKTTVSDLLLQETRNLSDTQILEVIKALTGVLDDTYTDETSAVKMAIMKAVKAIVQK